MSARNLDCLDFGELAAFIATNPTTGALVAVLDSLAARSGGKVRRLVTAMRAAITTLAEQPATPAESAPSPKRRSRKPKAEVGEAVASPATVHPAAAPPAPARIIVPASLPHHIDPDDGSEDRHDTPHPTAAELCRDKVPAGAVRRRSPGLKHYSPPGIGVTREMKAGKAHDRRLLQAVADAETLPCPGNLSWIDHLRDCAARNGVSLRCSLVPALHERSPAYVAPDRPWWVLVANAGSKRATRDAPVETTADMAQAA